MRIIRGEEAQEAFANVRPTLTGQPFAQPITITGTAFVVASACQIVLTDGPDVLATWNDSAAGMRKIVLEEGESVRLVPTGQGVVYTEYRVDFSASALSGSGGLGATFQVPLELAGGTLLIDIHDGAGNEYPSTQWLWKVGTMLWNMTTQPWDSSVLVPPPTVQRAMSFAAPQQTTAFNVQDIASTTNGYFLAGARTTVTNKIKGLPITKSGVGSVDEAIGIKVSTQGSSPGSTMSYLLAITEIPVHPTTLFETQAGTIAWDLAVKTLYTVIPWDVINAIQDCLKIRLTFYFPGWIPAGANDIWVTLAPDIIQTGATGIRASGGYAPKLFGARQGTAGILLAPVGFPSTPPLATNLQPLA